MSILINIIKKKGIYRVIVKKNISKYKLWKKKTKN